MGPIKYQEAKANSIVLKTTGAMLFSVLGIMGFFYSTWNRNFSSALWCIPLEISCILLLIFTKSYINGELHLKYSSPFFRAMKYVSLVFCVAAWIATVAYIAVAVANNEYKWFRPQSHFIAVPVSIFAGFSCLVLFLDTRKYETLLELEEAKI